MKKIQIDRLELRLKGISAKRASSLAAGLGNELSKQLAGQHIITKEKGAVNIDKIDTGALQAPRAATTSSLRQLIAGRIASSIASSIKSPSPKIRPSE